MNYIKLNPAKILIYGAVIVFMSQINALVDLYEHPDIPYFDREHFVVGAVVGFFMLLIGIVTFLIIRKLEKKEKEQEELLKQLFKAKERAEESDCLKSAFLANMSHEIRTPMNGILGFADLLDSSDLDAEDKKRYLDIIKKSGNRLLSVINDIIDISKIESGQISINISTVDVYELLDEVYIFFKPEAENKGLQLSNLNGQADERLMIETDKEKVFATLMNLVKNALKYTDKGSIEFGCEQQEHFLKFFVNDTGIGVPADRQKDIFERFVQANTNDKKVTQGSGLGLAISKSYIKMLGGEIGVWSSDHTGSKFYFTIPHHDVRNQTKDTFETIE